MLIVNAPDQFLNTLLEDGYKYTIDGVDLGLGILFVESKQEADEALSIIAPLISKSNRAWIAATNLLRDDILTQLKLSVKPLNLLCNPSQPIGSDWSAVCIETI